MRKFFAILFLIFGISFVALPFIPMGCNDVTASAEVVPGSRYNYNSDIYYNQGLTLTVSGKTVDFPDVYYIPFNYALGGLNVVNSAHYVYIPFQLLLTDNGFLQFNYAYYDLVGGVIPSGDYGSLLFQLNGQYNVNQVSNFTCYSSQSDSVITSSAFIDNYSLTVYYYRSSASVAPYPIISPNANADIVDFVNTIEVRYYRTYVDIVFLLPRVVSNNILLQDSTDFVRVRIEDTVGYDGYFPLGTRPVTTSLLSTLSFSVEFLNISNIYNDGYNKGYADGETVGIETGFNNGFADGVEVGYREGINEGLNDITPWEMLVSQVDAFFNIPLFGSSVTFGTLLSIGFGILLLGLCIKLFLGG